MSNKGASLTKKPRTAKELTALEIKAKSIGGDTLKAYLILRYAGCHSRVLFPYDFSDKKKLKYYNLVCTLDEDNDNVFQWDRPKKKGAKAYTTVPIHPNIDFDVDSFIDGIKARTSNYKKSTKYCNWLISELGKACNIPGLSPLSLRHSLAVELLKGGLSIKDVCDLLNISASTLRTYGRYLPKDRHAGYKRAMGIEGY